MKQCQGLGEACATLDGAQRWAGHGEGARVSSLPATPGAEGLWGLTPCSSQFLHSAGTCLSSKHRQEDKKQKHQQERGLTAKLRRNQMSFFRACFHPGNLGYCTSASG